ncbi:maleylpyruvate isomerase family mycothiol-dependent enzyme [Aeromicrobium sp. Leaf350]|uniref:maleylpyruvate isomerase family mycothiol-dependent enzyme n=1 Tax=Aeromicrobium sp. Leaf350 TaxID=2876565 RepID=UPI001E536B36|nr:maleylpyruvate isomerase family mycothiol-dependent enzyme [Aeromicrobium sp. Leaf350]
MTDDMSALAKSERASLVQLLQELDDSEWDRPSLCDGWSVREVAIHVVSYDDLGWSGLPMAFIRGGLRVDSVNAWAVARHASLSDDEVIELVRRCETPRGLTSAMKGAIALTDGLIHQQDIRRALDRPREIPAERLLPALNFALKAPTLPAKRNARGLRLVANDHDWARGPGDEVTGPGESLLMAIAGRPAALDELSGPGLATLVDRVS